MANEKRLIDANALAEHLKSFTGTFTDECGFVVSLEAIIRGIEFAPTVDAVSRGVHDQVRWERDVAIEQLEEHGIPFGGIAPDVVKVVRCKDCKHCKKYRNRLDPMLNHQLCARMDNYAYGVEEDGFCSYGERRPDGNTLL